MGDEIYIFEEEGEEVVYIFDKPESPPPYSFPWLPAFILAVLALASIILIVAS